MGSEMCIRDSHTQVHNLDMPVLQIALHRVQMAQPPLASWYSTLSICLNVVLLIVVFHLLSRDPRLSVRPTPRPMPRSTSHVIIRTTQCRPVAIRSTRESLHAMYGEGNFSDDEEHLLNYIRSMMTRQGPGGRHLSEPSRIHFSQVSQRSRTQERILPTALAREVMQSPTTGLLSVRLFQLHLWNRLTDKLEFCA